MFGRWSKSGVAAAAILTAVTAAGPAASQPTAGGDPALERMMAGESQMQGEELERTLAAAAAHPLGTQENPVRAAMPPGQRAYLSRLRCADGRAPRFSRIGSMGVGVYGNIIDGYRVLCIGSQPASSTIIMDMYHRGHVEDRAVPGFTIVPADGGPRAPLSPTV